MRKIEVGRVTETTTFISLRFTILGQKKKKKFSTGIQQYYLIGYKCSDTIVERIHFLWLDSGDVAFFSKYVDNPWIPAITSVI